MLESTTTTESEAPQAWRLLYRPDTSTKEYTSGLALKPKDDQLASHLVRIMHGAAMRARSRSRLIAIECTRTCMEWRNAATMVSLMEIHCSQVSAAHADRRLRLANARELPIVVSGATAFRNTGRPSSLLLRVVMISGLPSTHD